MADLTNKNRLLTIKKHEAKKLQALAYISSKEVRVMELEDEIQRCYDDMEAQKKLIGECEFNIKQQKEEMEKEKVEAEADAPKGKGK